jgi:hypothetical protein
MSGQSSLLILLQAALIRLIICFLVTFLLGRVLSNWRKIAFCCPQLVLTRDIGFAFAEEVGSKNNINIGT